METKKNPIDLSQMTAEEKKALLAQLNADANESRQAKRDAYEGLRAEFMHRVEEFLVNVTADVKGFKQ